MRLTKVGLAGYRRFASGTEMNVDADVIAIVGPNEAGKSSFLEALTLLDESEFPPSALTRGGNVLESQAVVWALFRVEDKDREELETVPGGVDVRWLRVVKNADGELHYELKPTVKRDRRLRERLATKLDKALRARRFRSMTYGDEPVESLVRDALKAIQGGESTLPLAAITSLEFLRDVLEDTVLSDQPKYLQSLESDIAALVEHETQDHPSVVAEERLASHLPPIVLFGDAERSLESSYDLGQLAEEPPPALANVARLAGLDLVALRDAAVEGDRARVEELEEDARVRLDEAFADAWRQYRIRVRAQLDGQTLHLLVSRTAGGYTDMAERSDGLRAFIALLAFVRLIESETRPILLIDEAEAHLHYDAQADLVRVFSSQRAAAKVIYTTHSAGCLPDDLGTGVRVIAPTPESDHSEIRNAFWQEGPGFTGLLLGMGASALAFAATRYAVITEGPTEMILLPSLFREALEANNLGFQVAPGLAEVAPGAVASIDLTAARVAYVVDSDKGGKAIARKLRSAGIPERLIIERGDSKQSPRKRMCERLRKRLGRIPSVGAEFLYGPPARRATGRPRDARSRALRFPAPWSTKHG
jgi:hypothetical protein